MELEARNCPPPHWSQDCEIARRCKLFLGTDLERCAMVLEDPFVWPPVECRESSQRQTCNLSLTLSESTTRDGLRLASRTPQAALRLTESWPERRSRKYRLTLRWRVRLSPVPLKRKTEPDHRPNLPLFAPLYFC